MSAAFRELVRHGSWATRRLLEHCSGLPAEALEMTAPGTFGSVIETLRHLGAAEERYLSSLEGRPPRPDLMEAAALDLEGLRRQAADQAARWEVLLLAPPDLAGVVTRRMSDGSEQADAVRALLVQTVHHGNDHRTHVCTILGSAGLEVPALDGWAFVREAG